MADLLATGAAWLSAQLRAHAATMVIYRRGGQSVSLPATIGKTMLEQADEAGANIRGQVRDYLIAVADLQLGGQWITPRRGDQIEETDESGVTHVYAVLPIASEPEWRYSDPHRQTFRIHTKKVG